MNGVPHQFVHSLFFFSSRSCASFLSAIEEASIVSIQPKRTSRDGGPACAGWGLTDDGVEEGKNEALSGRVEHEVESEVVVVGDDQVRVAATIEKRMNDQR